MPPTPVDLIFDSFLMAHRGPRAPSGCRQSRVRATPARSLLQGRRPAVGLTPLERPAFKESIKELRRSSRRKFADHGVRHQLAWTTVCALDFLLPSFPNSQSWGRVAAVVGSPLLAALSHFSLEVRRAGKAGPGQS